MEEEIWLPVTDYPNYMVSSWGKVKCLNFNRSGIERLLSNRPNKVGYVNVHLWNKEIDNTKPKPFRRCRLVAMHFKDNPFDLEYVNHKNGIRHDDRACNVEWTSHRENVTHSFKHNMGSTKLTGAFKKRRKGVWNGKWGSAIRINNKLKHLGYFHTEEEAHDRYLEALKDNHLINSYAY